MNALIIRQIQSQTVLKSLKGIGSLRQANQLSQFQNFYIVALKRYLYILGEGTEVQSEEKKRKVKVLNRFEFEASVRFEIFENIEQFEQTDMIAIMHEQDKIVNFYGLLQFLEQPVPEPKLEMQADQPEKDEKVEDKVMMPNLKPLFELKNLKKVTTLLNVCFDDKISGKGGKIQGMLFGDKVGNIQFINLLNLPKLKNQKLEGDEQQQEESSQNSVAKLMYGHMQICTTIQRSKCGQFIVSSDTMNKVVVNNFPNMFNLQAVNTDQQATLVDICINDQLFATVSNDSSQKPLLRLIIADIQTGKTLFEDGLGQDGEVGSGQTSMAFDTQGSKLCWVEASNQDGQIEKVKTVHIEKSNEGVYKFKEIADDKNEVFTSSSESNTLYILKDQLNCSSYLLEAQYDKVKGYLSTPIEGSGQEDQIAYLTKL